MGKGGSKDMIPFEILRPSEQARLPFIVHVPHSSTNVPFLRRSNSGSALCLTCHIK